MIINGFSLWIYLFTDSHLNIPTWQRWKIFVRPNQIHWQRVNCVLSNRARSVPCFLIWPKYFFFAEEIDKRSTSSDFSSTFCAPHDMFVVFRRSSTYVRDIWQLIIVLEKATSTSQNISRFGERHWTLVVHDLTMTSRGSLVLAGRNEFGATWFASQGHLSSRRVQGLQKRRTWAALKDKDKRRRWWLHDWGLLLAWRWKSH